MLSPTAPEAGSRRFVIKIRQLIDERAFGYYGALRRAHEFVLDNYHRKITLGSVADVADMERTYFSSFFHERVGVPFRDWLRFIRIDRALDLLAQSDEPIARVSKLVGFQQVRSFERAFKKVTQLTPLQYRKMTRPRRFKGNGFVEVSSSTSPVGTEPYA